MGTLKDRHCKPCEGGTQALSEARARRLLAQVRGWRIAEDGNSICRDFRFGGFGSTVLFINALAWIANREGHHPDFHAGYNYCTVTFTTHAIGGLSENDFICAARLNQLAEN